MDETTEKIKQVRELFEKARIKPEIELKNILVVLDETLDRQTFIFQIITLLQNQTQACITFLLAVRSYQKQALEKGIELETLPELIRKVRDHFSDREDVYDIVFIPEKEIEPFERIKEVLERQKSDLVIIPAPFTLSLLPEEVETSESLGKTVDNAIFHIVFEKKIPLLLIKDIESRLPFTNVTLLVQKAPIRNDILGWMIPLISKDCECYVYHSKDLKEKEIEKIDLLSDNFSLYAEKKGWSLKIVHSSKVKTLSEFCTEEMYKENGFIIIQTKDNLEDEPRELIKELSADKINVLLIPPEKES